MEPKSNRLVSPGVKQTEGSAVEGIGDTSVSRNGRSGDPNLAGWADTAATHDPMAGPLQFDNDNECYKRFLLQDIVPESALGVGNDVLDHDPPKSMPEPTRRDGGSHSGWGGVSAR